MIISSVGAVRTIESEIPVISVINGGIFLSGFKSSTKRSVITPSSNLMAAISMILSLTGSRPVVSKSNAIKQDRSSFFKSSLEVSEGSVKVLCAEQGC